MISENKIIIRPLIVGGIVVLYEHFNNSRGLPMMVHYKVGGLAVGASIVSNYIAEMIELPNDSLDLVKTPFLSGLVFGMSKKYVLGSRSYMMDYVEGSGAEIASSLSLNVLSSFW